MRLNFDQLRTFVTVVDAGGIHRAAARNKSESARRFQTDQCARSHPRNAIV